MKIHGTVDKIVYDKYDWKTQKKFPRFWTRTFHTKLQVEFQKTARLCSDIYCRLLIRCLYYRHRILIGDGEHAFLNLKDFLMN